MNLIKFFYNKQISNNIKIKKFLLGLFKIKETLKDKKYYVLGIQFYKKRNINMLYFAGINEFILSAWFKEGATPELLEHIKLLSKSSIMLETLSNDVWLIYLSCLLLFNKKTEAQSFLKIYHYYYSDKNIENYIIVSNFAKENNITNDLINKSSMIWSNVCNRKNVNDFDNYLKNKTIAIVGGSGCELGKNKGLEIDSHDIVVRFANYPTDEKFFCDYGQKTTIWVRQSSKDLVHKPDISQYDYVFWKEDFNKLIINKEHIQIIDDYNKQYDKKLVISESKYYRELYEKTGIYRPTAGCLFIWYLYNILGSLKNVDIYGFSFLSKDYKDTKHYFDNVCKVGKNHDMKLEIDFLYELYSGNKNAG